MTTADGHTRRMKWVGGASIEEAFMKFRAMVVFEFNASSLVDAGHKVDDAVKHAQEADEMEAKRIDLQTPPAGPPVVLPPSA